MEAFYMPNENGTWSYVRSNGLGHNFYDPANLEVINNDIPHRTMPAAEIEKAKRAAQACANLYGIDNNQRAKLAYTWNLAMETLGESAEKVTPQPL